MAIGARAAMGRGLPRPLRRSGLWHLPNWLKVAPNLGEDTAPQPAPAHSEAQGVPASSGQRGTGGSEASRGASKPAQPTLNMTVLALSSLLY